MAAVEVIYLLAASLWIGIVVAALCIGVRVVMKLRARRRRMNRFLDVVWTPVRLCTGQAVLGSREVHGWRRVGRQSRGSGRRGRRPVRSRQFIRF